MNGLKALNYIYEHWNCNHPTHCLGIEKHFSTIEKELKALEIIKRIIKLENYLDMCLKVWETITQEEYDLLKEVLL